MASALTKSGEKKRIATPSKVTKNFWENFEGDEMGVLAAFVKAYQKITFTYRDSVMVEGKWKHTTRTEFAPYHPVTMSAAQGVKRPWSPLERIQLALTELTNKKFLFRACVWDKAQNIVSATAQLPADTLYQSKEYYDAIIGWKESVLNECVVKYGKVLEKFGYEKISKDDFAPLTMENDKSNRSIMEAIKNTAPEAPDVSLSELVTEALSNGPLSRQGIVQVVTGKFPVLKTNSVGMAITQMLSSEKIEKVIKEGEDTGLLALRG